MSMHDHITAGFGDRLREVRQAAAMSQRELSFPGCTAVYICRIEKGQRTPSLQVAEQLAVLLNVDPHWLCRGEGDPTPKLVVRVPCPGMQPAALPAWLTLDIQRYAAAQLQAARFTGDVKVVGLA